MHADAAAPNLAIPTLPAWDRWMDRAFRSVALVAALTVGVALAVVLLQLMSAARPTLLRFGLEPLTSREWSIANEKFGMLPEIWGTCFTATIAVALAGFFGVLIAILLSQDFLPPAVANVLRYLVELLAAVPSVVFGLWGVFVVIPLLRGPLDWLHEQLAWTPFFATPFLGPSVLPASLVLAIMVLPTIASLARDALAAVPTPQRDGAFALGATKWETIRKVVVPTAFPGLLGAVILGYGRALGETMAVAMLVGNNPSIGVNLFQPANTLATLLANNFAEAERESLHAGALTLAALALLTITLVVNMLGAGLASRAARFRRGAR